MNGESGNIPLHSTHLSFCGVSVHAGYVATICFLLFTGVGACAQIYKLSRRTILWKGGALDRESICEGLHPVREMWSFSAFLLFALSGLTRSYIDYFLVLSRLPVVLLSTGILWFLATYGGQGSRRYFLASLTGVAILLTMIMFVMFGYRFHDSPVSWIVDTTLSVVSLLLFYGKQLQAWTMYREKRSHAVSWLRELGLVIKDGTGLWYSLSVGSELRWVSVTHVLSALSSSTICIVKFVVERRTPLRREEQRSSHS